MVRVVGPPTTPSTDVGHSLRAGPWGGASPWRRPAGLSQISAPSSLDRTIFAVPGDFPFMEGRPWGPRGHGYVGSMRSPPLAQAKLRTSASSRPDRLICAECSGPGMRGSRGPRVATSDARTGRWGTTGQVEFWSHGLERWPRSGWIGRSPQGS